jgi:hypothetical protein
MRKCAAGGPPFGKQFVNSQRRQNPQPETASAMVEKVYVTSLPWIRAQLRLQAHKFSRVSLDSEFSGGRMNILH